MRPVATDGVAWSVCLSDSVLGTAVTGEPCKTAQPIEMPFGKGADLLESKEGRTLAPIGKYDKSISAATEVHPIACITVATCYIYSCSYLILSLISFNWTKRLLIIALTNSNMLMFFCIFSKIITL